MNQEEKTATVNVAKPGAKLQVSSSETVTIALKYGSIDVILEDQGQTSVELDRSRTQ